MSPDRFEVLEHLQAIERMTGVPVGQQCVELLRYVDWKHPHRPFLIDLATGFSSVAPGIELRAEAIAPKVEISMDGIRNIPGRVNFYEPGQGPD